MGSKFSILITTFNRLEELKYTLTSLEILIRDGVRIIICDDASTDGTSAFIQEKYPEIQLLINPVNKGLIYSRNRLMGQVQTPYAISIDDDANFLSENVLEEIANYFEKKDECGVISFRVYWGITRPEKNHSNEDSCKVKSFLGGAHVWRIQTWKEIPNYPDWYRFYGEENFAALQLLKKRWEVHYLPSVLVHHRVDNKARKKDADYYLRARRSIRADWYNYFTFYPQNKLIRLFLYSIKMQLLKAKKTKDIKVLKNLFLALSDMVKNSNRLQENRNSLTITEYNEWKQLPDAKIYWEPNQLH
ncbi:glycosyltransferase [Salegentibacter mishustinae]|uniref:glycosyltransferase family 2 protein n=1 Tax=Salegentibacter mishustinae TaxID=270918 RepID=UPI001CE1D7CC|nr:glycosyltransferase [Salegentibacter mishustinae]UBZ07448.1 glycosyltransferase [Salegentibacter mishustinae]